MFESRIANFTFFMALSLALGLLGAKFAALAGALHANNGGYTIGVIGQYLLTGVLALGSMASFLFGLKAVFGRNQKR